MPVYKSTTGSQLGTHFMERNRNYQETIFLAVVGIRQKAAQTQFVVSISLHQLYW